LIDAITKLLENDDLRRLHPERMMLGRCTDVRIRSLLGTDGRIDHKMTVRRFDVNRWIVVMLAAVVLAAGMGEAYASTVNYPTRFVQFKLKTSSGKRTFSGQIDSSTSKCTKGRTVEVIRKSNNNQQTLGKDGTNSDGKFSISLSSGQVKNGTYYAKAKTKKYDSDQKVCKSAQSGTIKVS
jgi:5-hydroxyisourate hydrolase-like protein (transthyretin family)